MTIKSGMLLQALLGRLGFICLLLRPSVVSQWLHPQVQLAVGGSALSAPVAFHTELPQCFSAPNVAISLLANEDEIKLQLGCCVGLDYGKRSSSAHAATSKPSTSVLCCRGNVELAHHFLLTQISGENRLITSKCTQPRRIVIYLCSNTV